MVLTETLKTTQLIQYSCMFKCARERNNTGQLSLACTGNLRDNRQPRRKWWRHSKWRRKGKPWNEKTRVSFRLRVQGTYAKQATQKIRKRSSFVERNKFVPFLDLRWYWYWNITKWVEFKYSLELKHVTEFYQTANTAHLLLLTT